MNHQEGHSRRIFLKETLLVTGSVATAGCSLTWLSGCVQTDPVSAVDVSGPGSGSGSVTLDLTRSENVVLKQVGGTLALGASSLDSQGILLYRASQSEVHAYSRRCTHAGCTVRPYQGGLSECPCHLSQFDTSGRPVRGPAVIPLQQYQASLQGDVVTISR